MLSKHFVEQTAAAGEHPDPGQPRRGRRRRGVASRTMPNVGPLELAIVLVIALVIFGPKRLPELGKSLGKGIREFKDPRSPARTTTTTKSPAKLDRSAHSPSRPRCRRARRGRGRRRATTPRRPAARPRGAAEVSQLRRAADARRASRRASHADHHLGVRARRRLSGSASGRTTRCSRSPTTRSRAGSIRSPSAPPSRSSRRSSSRSTAASCWPCRSCSTILRLRVARVQLPASAGSCCRCC